ncbi:MAG: hypothetical protein EGQ58_17185 [Phocaeicola dorei]|uniref:Uncharacterized protein n=2 Tax=Phocaeicola TaxID=909656 RepID=A0A412VPP2_PHOVU|nr:hypothetical protein F2Z06_03200 [Phocaeicola dorei]KAB3840057.1 hypothetical protein GAS47_16600 [Phocaeicola vulgatus]RGD23343.1 hypothetical protein DW646_20795 [Bacteroides sp. AM23-18]RJU66386.1 hypothetical protein DW750_20045 [Bacteroides sp. AM28-6]RJV54540.1 hypothetical protein DWW63_20760 [Bacteroides sp. AF16-29]RJX09292.1 hypothetical protein DWW74_02130 [Bacteroides sp. AF17-1]
MLENIIFFLLNLQISIMFVPLHCVFHSIRFKVNKGWSKALLLFLCLYLCIKVSFLQIVLLHSHHTIDIKLLL